MVYETLPVEFETMVNAVEWAGAQSDDPEADAERLRMCLAEAGCDPGVRVFDSAGGPTAPAAVAERAVALVYGEAVNTWR